MNIIKDFTNQNQHPIQPDIQMAKRFLSFISQCDENDNHFSFQTFPEKENQSKPFARILSDTIEDHEDLLINLNKQEAGIFVTVNKTDGKGRKKDNIIEGRTFFIDLDGASLEPVLEAPISPHLIVESSPGRYHAYWIVENIKLEYFSDIQKQLSSRFGSDPQVNDLGRVMRLPGFFHHKKDPFFTKIIEESGEQPIQFQKFLDNFKIKLLTNTNSFDKVDSDKNNPILKALDQQGLLIQKQSHPKGCWTIQCPWKHLHSKEDKGTKYYEPNTNSYSEHGFKCFHQHCENKNIYDLTSFLNVTFVTDSNPLPLFRKIKEPMPFPCDALGKTLGSISKTLQRVIKAPDAICGQSVLATACLCAQPYANIGIDGREFPLSLYFITVAESGDRKSATDKIVLAPIYMWQKMQSNIYVEENRKYRLLKETWEERKKRWLKKEPEKNMFFDEKAPIEPIQSLMLFEEPTYEGIVKYFDNCGFPSIGLFSDEGGRFFGGHAMNRDNMLKTLAGLSSFWDGKPISRLRSEDGASLLYGRRFCLHLLIQENIFCDLMKNSLFDLQGFLPRCLIAFPASTAGQRPYLEENINYNSDFKSYRIAINNLLDQQLPIALPPAPQNELVPRLLTLSPEAKREWIIFHDRIDSELPKNKEFYVIRRFASKIPEQVLRLSGVLSLIENPKAETINSDCLKKGIQLSEYYLNERLRIHGYSSINPNLICAQELLNWFWGKGLFQVGLTTIYQYGPSSLGIRNAENARKIINILEAHGWVIKTPNLFINNVKNKEAWTILPPQT
ncbi:MAG: hypothetical protein KR126chlam4_00197 [Candidatus Anoxychlamydiales bacterium]|nr:hypothetical protein [Candidatus Anoxychlamydiales bacterium]